MKNDTMTSNSSQTMTDYGAMNTTTIPEPALKSISDGHPPANLGDKGRPTPDDIMGLGTGYIIGGAVTAGVVVVLGIVMVVVVVIMRRKRRQERDKNDREAGLRGDGIYDEIAEAKRKKRNKEKKKKMKKKTASRDPNQNHDDCMDTNPAARDSAAPDIIAAHDNEAIYETLDGRRAARAKASHVTTTAAAVDQSGDRNVDVDAAAVRRATSPDFTDSTYDHLGRFAKPKCPRRPPPNVLEKRLTDPEVVVRRPKLSRPKPRSFSCADFAVRNGNLRNDPKGRGEEVHCGQWRTRQWCAASPGASPSGSVRSSLTELARQSVSGGKRLVCQLTMVGVVEEDGKPVPVSPPAASNAYFILEPSADVAQGTGNTIQSPSAPRFRIKTDTPREDDAGEVQGAAATSSDYFVLEPLDESENLMNIVEEPYPEASMDSEEYQSLDSYFTGSGHHGNPHSSQRRHDVSSLTSSTENEEHERPQIFRNIRAGSCPHDASFVEDADSSVLKHLGYSRSYSSPQSTQHRRGETDHQKKMDSDALKARIQQEMIALGFRSDPEGLNNTEETDDAPSESQTFKTSPAGSTRNDYFVLESELKGQGKEDNPETNIHQSAMLPDADRFDRCEDKPAHQQQHLISPTPPPLPKRNGHNRSKSETRLSRRTSVQGEDQGPVIVSLKRHGPQQNQSSSELPDNDANSVDPYRPRLQSESGILSERPKRLL